MTTASDHNKEYLLSLGASSVLSYKSPTVLEDLLALGPYKAIWSAQDTAADQEKIGKILAAQGGGEFLATMGPRPGVKFPPGTGASFVQYLDDYLKEENKKLTEWLFWEFQEEVFRDGRLKLGKVEVVGGLESIQGALDRLKAGKVSGTRLVVKPHLE